MSRIMMMNKAADRYESLCGRVMKREHGKTPNGNDLGGFWVLRDPAGKMIDYDQFRLDLAERNNLSI